MTFQDLHARLIDHIRARVRSGELSERGLARLTGVSQPHIHNVLKGTRFLSDEMSDQILKHLRLQLTDLMGEGQHVCGLPQWPDLPVLDGCLGPGYPFPQTSAPRERFLLPPDDVSALQDAVAVRLGADPAMSCTITAGDYAVLERCPSERTRVNPLALFVVRSGEAAVVRRIAVEGTELKLFGDCGVFECSISLPDRNILGVVTARVVWIGHHVEFPAHCSTSV